MDSNDCYVFSFGGLLLGGAVGVATRQLIEEKMHRLYALCGGILLGLLSLEIIPETFSSYEMIKLYTWYSHRYFSYELIR